jgi:hypothetical protein
MDEREEEDQLNLQDYLPEPSEEEKKPPIKMGVILLSLFLFLLALLPRLYFIFFVSTPDNPGAGWFGDAYHHWQVAYLTREIGLSEAFLRLWDLKGMEYFWGLFHPLATIAAFEVTGSVAIAVERSLTALFGSVSVVLIFFLVRRFWGSKAAVAAALFAALNPVGVFNDGTGMVEPLGIPFLLLGVLAWPAKALLAGFSLALATTTRAEYWVFSICLVGAMTLFTRKERFDHKVLLWGGFLAGFLPYLKYLLERTGNALYPFYWNYMANIKGEWQHKPYLTAEDIQAQQIFLAILIVSAFSALLVLWRRPKGKFLYLLGLGNWIFLSS